MHGIKRRASLFNTNRIDHLYQDPHEKNRNLILHYGDLTDSMNLTRIIQEVQHTSHPSKTVSMASHCEERFRGTKESRRSKLSAKTRNDSNRQPEIRNTHINIGTGKEISIKALAELIAKTAGFKGKLVFNSSKPDGTMPKLTDVSKLHELGWHHKIEIEEGIQKVYEWYAN